MTANHKVFLYFVLLKTEVKQNLLFKIFKFKGLIYNLINLSFLQMKILIEKRSFSLES